MKYGLLLWPHANGRYRKAVLPLTLFELERILCRAGIEARGEAEVVAGVTWLTFETGSALSAEALDALGRHSTVYLLAEFLPDGAFRPLEARARACLGEDLNGILKYKGKTNEQFTRFMLNIGVCESVFSAADRLRVIDPMCGRATTLFECVNQGYDGCGADLNAGDLDEGFQFFKRYLEYHKIRHEVKTASLTLPDGRAVPVRRVVCAPGPSAQRSENARALEFLRGDAADALRALPKNSAHVLVCDLPYGVQHAPGNKESFEDMLYRMLTAAWRTLKPGGAAVLSFNTYTLKTGAVRGLLARAGFEVRSGGGYDGLSHWVEQAIVRDVAIGVKPV